MLNILFIQEFLQKGKSKLQIVSKCHENFMNSNFNN